MLRSAAYCAALLLVAACSDKPGPAAVDPADDGSTDGTTQADLPPQNDGPNPTSPPDVPRADTGAGNPEASGIWVEDNDGVAVGLLVRRGSDDATAMKSIYDVVSVFHPASGLFFEITMSDGVVRLPQNTYFEDGACRTPIGIGVGTCQDCKAGYGIGILAAGKWYRVIGGSASQQMGPDGLKKGGLGADECIVHGTGTAKGYPVQAVSGEMPPFTFAAPLRFVAR